MNPDSKSFSTPILFIVFNRPEVSQITFEAIKKVKPQKLYIAADGPRTNNIEDIEKCEETRKIIDLIDWDCEVVKLFRKENVGVVKGVVSAIDWFFENEEMGIILEDDCYPSSTFFSYSSELLQKYKNSETIMHISGSNFIETTNIDSSYYFSKFGSCWGWATWKRAWNKYDLNLIENVSEKNYLEIIRSISTNNYHYEYFKNHLSYHRIGQDNIWDWRWSFCIWFHNGLVINPQSNLIKNIGYGKEATTSKGDNEVRNKISELEISEFKVLKHPKIEETNFLFEKKIQNIYNPPLSAKAKIKKAIGIFIPAKFKNTIKNILNLK